MRHILIPLLITACGGGGKSSIDAAMQTDAAPTSDAATHQSTIGNYDPLATPWPSQAGFLYGGALTVSSNVTLVGFGIVSFDAGSHGQLALYRDVAGAPGPLTAASSTFTVAMGRNDEAVQGVALTPGMYWLMATFDATTNIGADMTGAQSPRAFVAHVFTDPLPNPFGTAMTETNVPVNTYITVTSP
jgi:hypothetical protein